MRDQSTKVMWACIPGKNKMCKRFEVLFMPHGWQPESSAHNRIAVNSTWSRIFTVIPDCIYFQNKKPKHQKMSTSYGHATVQFPGFKPAQFSTTDGVLDGSKQMKGRTLGFTDSTRRRLSKRERSRLLTLSRKWGRRYDSRRRLVYAFNTFDHESYWKRTRFPQISVQICT